MIHARGLTRHFRVKDTTVEAVRGIDLDVGQGELVAFLGPNGAGKSTTLRMLTTLLAPTAGSAVVAGCDVVGDPAGVRHRIGLVGQGNGAGHNQRVGDELVHQGRCYGLTRADAEARADELLASLGIVELAGRVVSTLSGGQRRRLDVAMGMVHRPRLLFLDEPSTGLDPQNRANLKDEILRLRHKHGTTVVLTTHYLDEADALADRVVVIDHGQVIADGTPVTLKADLVGDRVVAMLADRDDAGRAAAIAERIPGVLNVTVGDGSGPRPSVTVRTRDGAALVPRLVRALDANGVDVATLEVSTATLDDVFLALTGRSLRDSAVGGDRSPISSSGAFDAETVLQEAS